MFTQNIRIETLKNSNSINAYTFQKIFTHSQKRIDSPKQEGVYFYRTIR